MKPRNLIFMMMLSLLMFGCGSSKVSDTQTISTTSKEITRETGYTDRDSTVTLAPEKTTGVFALKADSLGNVVLKPLLAGTSDGLEAPTATIKNNILTVNCETKAREIFLKWKEKWLKEQTAIVEVRDVVTTLPGKEIVLPMTKWQGFLQISGYLFWLVLIAFLTYRIYQFRNSFSK